VILLLKYSGISNTFFGITATICSVLAAMLLYHFVTIPVERIRQSRVRVKKDEDAAMPVSWKG
jgi:peptidoglycan/LPS O-acetylase OafA/YrhL